MTAGDVYFEHLREQLLEQRDRKKSLEARGMLVVTSSATLVGLLFTVTAIGPAGMADAAHWTPLLLTATLLLFAAAAVFGLVAARPACYTESKVADLEKLLSEGYEHFWSCEQVEGQLAVAKPMLTIIKDAKDKNQDKGEAVKVGVTLQIFGTGALVLTVFSLLL